jgi:hypothetical protein
MDSNDPKARFFARTMHTPDDEHRAATRASLRDVSKALLPLHRALIEAAREEYTFGIGPVESPTHLLQLIQSDAFFEWLKPVTALIVEIDELVRRDFTAEEVEAIGHRLEGLFGPAADPGFAERYVPVLQRDIDVAAQHAAVRKTIGAMKR